MSLVFGLTLALLSTAALSYGFYLQHSASGSLPTLALRHPLRSLSSLFTSWRWLVGFVTGLSGWALYIIALGFAPLSLVQATSAGGVGTARLAGPPWRRQPVRGRIRWPWPRPSAAWCSLACHCRQVLLTRPRSAGRRRWPGHWSRCSSPAPPLVPGQRCSGPAQGSRSRRACSIRQEMWQPRRRWTAPARRLVFWGLLLVCHGLAFVRLQLAFQRGTALATAGVSTLLTNVLPILAGLTVFAEHMPGGGAGHPARARLRRRSARCHLAGRHQSRGAPGPRQRDSVRAVVRPTARRRSRRAAVRGFHLFRMFCQNRCFTRGGGAVNEACGTGSGAGWPSAWRCS